MEDKMAYEDRITQNQFYIYLSNYAIDFDISKFKKTMIEKGPGILLIDGTFEPDEFEIDSISFSSINEIIKDIKNEYPPKYINQLKNLNPNKQYAIMIEGYDPEDGEYHSVTKILNYK